MDWESKLDIVQYRKDFQKLDDLKEENVKNKLIVELFKNLGYSIFDFDFEPPVFERQRVDFSISIAEKNQILYVETKRGDQKLLPKHIDQIISYLYKRGIEWGILCNGKELLLINHNITSHPNNEHTVVNKVVFNINLFSNKDVGYLKFISKEFLFDKGITNYFRDIAQFKALKYPGNNNPSWSVYKSTLVNFFMFYGMKEKRYRPLDEIRVDDFEDYLRTDQKNKNNLNKKIKSQDTFNNKYSHIRSMLNELKANNKIRSHLFIEERAKMVKTLNTEAVQRNTGIFSAENIKYAITFLQSGETPLRDTVIFLFCIYMGLERSLLRKLEWGMFDEKRQNIFVEHRRIPIPELLRKQLILLEKENKSKNIKGQHLFYTYYRKKYNPITESAINDVFNRFMKINEDWRDLSPQFVRMNLIKILFENGMSIEKISFLTGMDLIGISKLISQDDIRIKVNNSNEEFLSSHPFEKILGTGV
ncbi:type I restriction enzyme HsdR N-terminal domain-containing protein [Paenibacillus sp. NEAU-GSW1]|uniref:type I restriction enzyme HsdR N-terminal domain-containing protein n=1 Tax=Paenibacillus sp. NEAU-GSW1 TaxID=2682486 RepID=UPI0012E177A7|nr:type I restriction enzyme HsdR N-terminal domain-containing protein [Paenibacillus sp. NEAU-GSW1]MUT65530.1 hypothetical protein [Paenibacillus sp. NEAU-GSW1]